MLNEVLDEVDSRLQFHDFRMVNGKKRINLIFDLVVPRDYKYSQYDQLRDRITRMVQERDKRCKCVINVENSYCAE